MQARQDAEAVHAANQEACARQQYYNAKADYNAYWGLPGCGNKAIANKHNMSASWLQCYSRGKYKEDLDSSVDNDLGTITLTGSFRPFFWGGGRGRVVPPVGMEQFLPSTCLERATFSQFWTDIFCLKNYGNFCCRRSYQ